MFNLNLHKFSIVAIAAALFFFSLISQAALITQKTLTEVFNQVLQIIQGNISAMENFLHINHPGEKTH